MTVSAIFFDLGGVVVRTEYQAPREHLAERLNTTYEDLYRIVFDSESSRQASLGAITTEAHWAAVARRLGRPASEVNVLRDEFFGGDVLDRRLLEFIRSLRPRFHTGVISNAWPNMRDYLRENSADDAFDVLVISAEVGVMKPEPRIYEIALQEAGVRASQAVFVDDTAGNVEAAQKLGMHGLLFDDPVRALRDLKAILG